jgi:transposase
MQGRKQYREWSPDQQYLLPPSPSDWLPDDDLAYFILDIVMELDLRRIERSMRRKDPRGMRPYHPRMMTALLLYGYSTGVCSSRKIERATYRDVAFRVISGGQHPDHSVISEFRRRHLPALTALFLQSVKLCQEAGMLQLGRVALDGTKVQGNASKHKAMSYERMLKTEAELEEEIKKLLKEAEQTDREEDKRFGKGGRGGKLPKELQQREQRLARIREAKEKLEQEAKEARRNELQERAERQKKKAKADPDPVQRKRAKAKAKKNEREAAELTKEMRAQRKQRPDERKQGPWPQHQTPHTTTGAPTAKAQHNFTDPDSRIMKRDGAYLQGYNAQTVVEDSHQVIVAIGLTNQAPDQQHLPPMLEQVKANTGQYPKELLADSGYWDEKHVEYCEQRQVDPYIATGRLKHGESPPSTRGRPPANLSVRERMSRKLRTKKGRETYRHRKHIVEPVYGQIRETQGLRRFLLRGLEKVRGEWALLSTGHNLRKLYLATREA